MKTKVENGDVKITKLMLSNKSISASVNIRDQVEGFDVFEDMTKPTLFATFFIADSINLLQQFPIIGEETIDVEFFTPGLKPTTLSFKVFEVSNVVREESGKRSRYILKGVSEEHLFNGTNVVAASFAQTLDKTVADIVGRYLNSKKPMLVDETKGNYTLVVPRLPPLQAIDMCRRRAVSAKYASSSYVFFENQKGFVFKTIEGLIEDGLPTIGTRIFNFIESPTSDKESQFLSNRTVQSYEVINTVDTVRNINNGMHYAVVDTFDVIKKTFDTSVFKLNESFQKLKRTNKGDQLPNTDDFIQKYASNTPRRFFIPKDTSKPDQYIEDMLPIRNSLVLMLNQNITRVLINGDSGLKVGDIIRLEAPEPTGITGKRKQDKLTGNYIVIRLRHLITNSTAPKHEVVFDCAHIGIPT